MPQRSELPPDTPREESDSDPLAPRQEGAADEEMGADTESALSGEGGIMRAAAVLALGNVASRMLGLARETVKASLFGTSPALSAFEIAVLVPTTLFDLLVGGMVNSALVPVFSEYALPERREELWRLASTFLSVAAVVLALVVAVVVVFAAPVAGLLGAYNLEAPGLTELTISLVRLAAPVVFFLSISSILTGVLYALKRFTLPAFTVATFNGTIVAVTLLLAMRPDPPVTILVWGYLLGALLQMALQLPGLRDARLRWNLNWRHPAIRRILLLYAPIVAGLVINQAGVAIGYNLTTATGDSSLTYMRYATTLYQFPLGLVVTAISIAILPTLSQQAQGTLSVFKATLAEGLRLVLALIIPAAAGLFVLAAPIVALLFQYGQFTPADTDVTALVLRLFLFGLPFAAADQMLIFASYARKDTLRPALVGVISTVVYVAAALTLPLLLRAVFPAGVATGILAQLGHVIVPGVDAPLAFYSLMLADATKHIVHTALMLVVLQQQIGGIGGYAVLTTALKAVVGALGMALAAAAVATLSSALLGDGGIVVRLLVVAGAAAVGLVVYAFFVLLLDIQEARLLATLLRNRLR
ncbi:MAG: murein biosynthesis integral membrane protein MurJ [Candidatus Promineifilaceae bacterium]|nr:murein biosynthesis integral membrane protein MurJ [Candidatus Promineifilaceae bacterium]